MSDYRLGERVPLLIGPGPKDAKLEDLTTRDSCDASTVLAGLIPVAHAASKFANASRLRLSPLSGFFLRWSCLEAACLDVSRAPGDRLGAVRFWLRAVPPLSSRLLEIWSALLLWSASALASCIGAIPGAGE